MTLLGTFFALSRGVGSLLTFRYRAPAVVYGSQGVGFTRIGGISDAAKWIWTTGGNTHDETIWCRKKNFCPGRLHLVSD